MATPLTVTFCTVAPSVTDTVAVFGNTVAPSPEAMRVICTVLPERNAVTRGCVEFTESGPTPPLYMPSFRDGIKDKELENLVTYLISIGQKQEAW